MAEKKLGFGMMRLPLSKAGDDSSVDVEETKKLVDEFINNGFTYFDTAWMYHDHRSECVVKEALVDRYPRDKFTLATKLHAGYLNSAEDCDRIFFEQMKKTGVDYFDYYLLHSINADFYKKFEEYGCFEWLIEKKKKGLVKKIGFSYHDNAALLDKILTEHPEMEFVQLQINYLDWNNDGIQSGKCYETAVKHNVPVVVMEPVKGGTLAGKLPGNVVRLFKSYAPDMSPASWAIRFAASLDNVFMVLSGMSSIEQMKDNISYMKDMRPLDDEERKIVFKAVDMINSSIEIQCTKCSYCVEGCPMGIPIPNFFELYNADRQEIEGKGWNPQESYYKSLAAEKTPASGCIACGACEGVCPQHLPIIEYLKVVSSYFEK